MPESVTNEWDVVRETAETVLDLNHHRSYSVRLEYYDYRMEFKVYRGCRQPDGSLHLVDVYHAGDGTPAVWLEGHVKWDGCCNFTLEPDGVMAHVCGLDEIHGLKAVFDTLYAAAVKIPHWDS